MIFTKKPVTIEAVQFKHIEAPGRVVFYGDEVPAWISTAMALPEFTAGALWVQYPDAPTASDPLMQQPHPRIGTLEGAMIVSADDWIIRGVKGEIYPCKPDIFEETYDGTPKDAFVEAFKERDAQDQPSFADIVDRLDAAKAKRDAHKSGRIGVLNAQQSREELMRGPARTVQPDRVAQAITDPIIRAYVEGMGSMMLDLQQDCIELRARIRAARRLVHAFLGSVEQSEAYERVMELLKDD